MSALEKRDDQNEWLTTYALLLQHRLYSRIQSIKAAAGDSNLLTTEKTRRKIGSQFILIFTVTRLKFRTVKHVN